MVLVSGVTCTISLLLEIIQKYWLFQSVINDSTLFLSCPVCCILTVSSVCVQTMGRQSAMLPLSTCVTSWLPVSTQHSLSRTPVAMAAPLASARNSCGRSSRLMSQWPSVSLMCLSVTGLTIVTTAAVIVLFHHDHRQTFIVRLVQTSCMNIDA